MKPQVVPANAEIETGVVPAHKTEPGQLLDTGFATRLDLWENGTPTQVAFREDATTLLPSRPGIYTYGVSVSGKDAGGWGDVTFAFSVKVK